MLSLVAPTNLFLGRGARKVEFFRVDVVSCSSYQLFWVGEPKNFERGTFKGGRSKCHDKYIHHNKKVS